MSSRHPFLERTVEAIMRSFVVALQASGRRDKAALQRAVKRVGQMTRGAVRRRRLTPHEAQVRVPERLGFVLMERGRALGASTPELLELLQFGRRACGGGLSPL